MILDESKWPAKLEENCKLVSSSNRINPSEEVGNNCRRDAVLASPSSGRHEVELTDDDGGPASCKNKHDDPFRQPCQ